MTSMAAPMDDNALRSTHLSDAADTLGIGIRQGGGGFNYLGDPAKTAMGSAFTVKQVAADTLPPGVEAVTRHGEAASTLASPGALLVVAVADGVDAATWGEAHTLRALGRGLAGVLVDGATRDIAALAERRFPILCRGSSPVRSAGRLHTIATEVEVVIAGVKIESGDLVAIDADGFVCIPAVHAEAVLAAARNIVQRENERDLKLRSKL